MPKKKMGAIQLKKRGFDVYVLEVIFSNMWQALLHGLAGLIGAQGRAVQVDPMKPTLKLPGAKRLKLKHHDPVSNFAREFNLRRDTKAQMLLERGAAAAAAEARPVGA